MFFLLKSKGSVSNTFRRKYHPKKNKQTFWGGVGWDGDVRGLFFLQVLDDDKRGKWSVTVHILTFV